MTAKTDLLLEPCPFCGGPAARIDFGPEDAENEGGSCIACTRCQSSGPVEFGRKENFASNWNRRAHATEPLRAQRDELAAEIEALRAEVERLSRYYKNGIDCFANPCERHSGERTPPFAEFFEKYGGQCLICVVDNNKALQAENERLAEALRDAATSMQTIADKAGRDEYLMTTDEVRGYANSRANAARAALAKAEGRSDG